MIRRLALSTLALTLVTGCALSVGGPASPAPLTPAGSAPASPHPTTSSASGTRTWTHRLVTSASRSADAGKATVKGGRVFEQATSLWAGCDGDTDEVTLTLGGKYRKLAGELALRDDVPAGIIIHTLVLVDGQPVQNVQLDAGDTATVAVNAVVTGARTATFQSKVVSGTCGPADHSYAVLGDGYVE